VSNPPQCRYYPYTHTKGGEEKDLKTLAIEREKKIHTHRKIVERDREIKG
jgi:hypothetical protein